MWSRGFCAVDWLRATKDVIVDHIIEDGEGPHARISPHPRCSAFLRRHGLPAGSRPARRADHRLYITEADAVPGDFAALQFEQSVSLINARGTDLDKNGALPSRQYRCRK
jgi:hypothetical protein